jgi:acyl carrier protein
MKTDLEVRNAIREFVIENFLMGDRAAMLKDSDSFLETGTIDSTGVLEVVGFLESVIGIKVRDQDLVPENFDSVDNLTRYVLRSSSAG